MNKSEQDALLHAITRRVVELDHRRRNDAQLDQIVLDYIDALDEVTELDRGEIETIARQVVRDRQGRGLHLPTKVLWLVGALALLLVLLLARAMGFKEGVTAVHTPDAIPALESRAHIVRSQLYNVLNQLNVVKLYFVEHCVTYGKCPTSLNAMGLQASDLAQSEHIGAIELTESGAIVVELGAVFGDDQRLWLQSDVLEFNSSIQWRCYTTIEQRFLGGTETAVCQHRDGVP